MSNSNPTNQMKKGLLLCLSIAVSIGAIAQSAERISANSRKGEFPAAIKNRTVKVQKGSIDNGVPVNNLQSRRYASPSLPRLNATYINEEVIGNTFYDLQTNQAISNRLVRNDDGTISAVWTFSPDAIQTPSIFPNRGTGYNYFDGTAWGPLPTSRLDAVRTGFTNIAVTSSGAEMTFQHYGSGMTMNRRPAKGTGAWTTSYPWGQGTNDTWPKAVASGDNVYVIWQGSGVSGTPVNGQDGPIFFSYSNDAGATWSTKSIISLIDSSNYLGFGGDNYSIDAQGNTVAIAYSDVTTDVGLLKSTDGGQTWTKTIVQTMPIPLFDINTMLTDIDNDGVVDTLNTNGGDAHVMIDNNDICHVWFSDYRWYCDQSTPGSYNYFPSTDGLFYWNETMPTDGYYLMAFAEDLNGNGTIDIPLDETCSGDAAGSLSWGQYRVAVTGMPSAGIDAAGTIYVSYQTIDELADTTFYHQAHRHVYVKTLAAPYTGSWTDAFDIVPSIAAGGDGENQEAVFACMAKKVDNDVCILYQRDNAPGHALAAAGTCDNANNLGNASDIVFARVEAATVAVNNVEKNDFSISQNYPNPASSQTYFNLNLKKASDVTITVTDMLGKSVYTEVKSGLATGSHVITLNTANWTSGVYSYTVIAAGQKVTRQLIVR